MERALLRVTEICRRRRDRGGDDSNDPFGGVVRVGGSYRLIADER